MIATWGRLYRGIFLILIIPALHSEVVSASEKEDRENRTRDDDHVITVSAANSPIKEEMGRFLIVLPREFPLSPSAIKSASFKIEPGGSHGKLMPVPPSLRREQSIALTQTPVGLEARVKLSQLPPGTFEISFKIKPSKSAWDSVKDKIQGREEPARCKHGLNLGELHAETRFQIDPSLEVADPGEAGLQTLEGIDSDKDGIRDDVQRWINEQGLGKRALTGAKQLARAKQVQILSYNNREASIAAGHKHLNAVDCMFYIMGLNGADEILAGMRTKYLNTDARIRAAIKNRANFHGQNRKIRSFSENKTRCDFDVDSVSN